MAAVEDIDAIMASINKKAKAEVLVKGSVLKDTKYMRHTTGSLSFDLALGGGWPLNCVNEIVGLESMGKTVIALKTIAAAQALDPDHHTLWVAAEDFDFPWAEQLGVDADRMTFVLSNIMEEAYESCDRVMKERAADAVVIDSLPALMPSEEDEKTMMEYTVGRGALLTNKFMRKCIHATKRSLTEADRNLTMLVINQWRDRVGVMFGDPRTTPGGKGKNFTYATRVDVSREEWLKDGDVQVGQTIKINTIKNKTAPPRRTGQVDFYFTDVKGHPQGSYDRVRELWDVAIERDVLERHGAWYHFKGKKWNGKDSVWDAMQQDESLVSAVDTEVRRQVLHIEPPPAAAPRKRKVVRK